MTATSVAAAGRSWLLATVIAVALTSCQGDLATPSPSGEGASPSALESAATSAATDGVTGRARPASDWRPSTPLSSRIDLSEADKMQKRAAELANLAKVGELDDPPQVELVRWIKPEEYALTLIGCLREEGFPADFTSDGTGVDTSSVPAEQASALELASYTCSARYSVDPRYSTPFNDEQLGILYDYLVESYVPCVEELGYDISDPPTREVFAATAAAEGWFPQAEIASMNGDLSEAERECPTYPSYDVLYGG